MRPRTVAILCLLCVASLGAVSPGWAQESQQSTAGSDAASAGASTAASAAQGPDSAASGASGQNTKGAATVVFFRENHFAGSALKPSVYVDGKETERLGNGRWFSVPIDPGKHELQSSAKNEPATEIEAAPGGTIYIEMVLIPGTWRGGGRLIAVDASGAQDKIAKLKPNSAAGN